MTTEIWIGLCGLVLTLLASAVTYGVLKQQVADLAKARLEDKAAAQREADAADQARAIERDLWAKVRDGDKEIAALTLTQLRDRLEACETTTKEAMAAASQVKDLTVAVGHLTERFGSELKHQSEVISMQTKALSEQVAALGHEQRNMRMSMGGDRRTRTTTAAKKG